MEIAVVRNERQRGIVNLRFRVGVLFLVVMEMILCRCLRRIKLAFHGGNGATENARTNGSSQNTGGVADESLFGVMQGQNAGSQVLAVSETVGAVLK